MLPVDVSDYEIRIADLLLVSLERTVRAPEGRLLDVPSGLEPIRLEGEVRTGHPAEQTIARAALPEDSAAWICFSGSWGNPCAIRLRHGDRDLLTGRRWQHPPSPRPQNYVVCPLQPWLPGVCTGESGWQQLTAAAVASEPGQPLRIHFAVHPAAPRTRSRAGPHARSRPHPDAPFITADHFGAEFWAPQPAAGFTLEIVPS